MTQVAAHRGIFESMVDLSDYGDLMNKFLALPFPRMSCTASRRRTCPTCPNSASTVSSWP
ncbi:hypothetical protein [Streptomyces sasae]|uniref:hypothetical protein n=1 Tax=Streptomyces sasae TaxID=1266772 RepID=UPI00293114BE|nr:hypothetical protein [Streptomyces sasae]